MAKEFVITGSTRFRDLEAHYPWIRQELGRLSGNGGILNSPMVRMMLQRSTVRELSRMVGMSEAEAVGKLNELLRNYEERMRQAQNPAQASPAGSMPWAPWADTPADVPEEEEKP